MTENTSSNSPAAPPSERLMREALAAARAGIDAGQTPFGACIARGDEIIAVAHNCVWGQTDPTAHAEIQAIRAACEKLGTIDLSGCVIYSSCEPCPMCWAATQWARVERIVYAGTRQDAAAAGFDDAVFHTELALPPSERSLPALEWMRSSAQPAFAAWRAKADRPPY